MEKINFQNNVTKANADTFNTMQDNIENAINSVSSNVNEIINGEVYSTNEVKTNKKWIDGKSIYRRVVKVNITTSVNSATNLFQASYIDNLTNCKYMVEAAGLIYIGNIPVNLYYKPLTHYFQESHSDSWWNSQPMTIIIEYTKTTD